ncbi:hypothetical protein ACHAWF_011672 [Thalassiosira exigua]
MQHQHMLSHLHLTPSAAELERGVGEWQLAQRRATDSTLVSDSTLASSPTKKQPGRVALSPHARRASAGFDGPPSAVDSGRSHGTSSRRRGGRGRTGRLPLVLSAWSVAVVSTTYALFLPGAGPDAGFAPPEGRLGDNGTAPIGTFVPVRATDDFDAKPPPPDVDAGAAAATGGERVLAIATAPVDYAHALALWTHLECLTDGIDRVVVTAPDASWSRGVIELIVYAFQAALAEEGDGGRNFTVEASFHRNDRYDAGLWCDGLHHALGYDGVHYGDGADASEGASILLVNDSVFSLRRYDGLTRKLARWAAHERRTKARDEAETEPPPGVKLLSLNGHLAKLHRDGKRKYYWVESVYRGLTPLGTARFYKHSCRSMSGEGAMPCRGVPNRKRCIVDHYEKGLAGAFKWEEIDAMFPSYRPNDWNTTAWEAKKDGGVEAWAIAPYPKDHWINGGRFFFYLVEEHGFPMRKVRKRAELETGECTSLLGDREWMKDLPYPSGAMVKEYQEEMQKSLEAS